MTLRVVQSVYRCLKCTRYSTALCCTYSSTLGMLWLSREDHRLLYSWPLKRCGACCARRLGVYSLKTTVRFYVSVPLQCLHSRWAQPGYFVILSKLHSIHRLVASNFQLDTRLLLCLFTFSSQAHLNQRHQCAFSLFHSLCLLFLCWLWPKQTIRPTPPMVLIRTVPTWVVRVATRLPSPRPNRSMAGEDTASHATASQITSSAGTSRVSGFEV